jgi:hypothetical protein
MSGLVVEWQNNFAKVSKFTFFCYLHDLFACTMTAPDPALNIHRSMTFRDARIALSDLPNNLRLAISDPLTFA